jgi:glycosyltransferase involved in cell wall biosynthesis
VAQDRPAHKVKSDVRVAVLVHNNVYKDSRVRKEIRTLVEAGYNVDVFGLAPDASRAVQQSPIEGEHRFELLLNSPVINKTSLRLASLIAGLALLIGALCLLPAQQRLSAVAILMLMPLIVLNASRHKSSRWAAIARGWLVLYALILFVLAYTDLLHIGVFAAGVATALLIYYLRITTKSITKPLRDRGVTSQSLEKSAKKILNRYGGSFLARYRRIKYRLMARTLSNRVLQGQYDIVHCHDLVALMAGGQIKKTKPETKLIWDAHEVYDELASGTEADKRYFSSIIRENQGLVDGFVTISESIANHYAVNYKLPPATIVMNATRGITPPHDDGRLRAAAQLNADRKIMLFQGGFSHKRGLGILMEAAADIPTPWTIVAMGWGKLEGDLKDVARRLAENALPGDEPLVVIPGAPQEELAAWTAGATIGIIPYEDAGLNHLYCTPNKLWEYPDAGVPILATDFIEMGRMIREWDTGFLLPRDFTSTDILEFVRQTDDDTIAVKRANCRRFTQQMSWAKFEPRLHNLYEAVVGSIPGPAIQQPGT